MAKRKYAAYNKDLKPNIKTKKIIQRKAAVPSGSQSLDSDKCLGLEFDWEIWTVN
jgi:hypothetical protein